MGATITNSTATISAGPADRKEEVLGPAHYSLIWVSALTILALLLLGTLWLRKYRSLVRTIRHLQGGAGRRVHVHSEESPALLPPATSSQPPPGRFEEVQEQGEAERTLLHRNKTKSVSMLPWRPPQPGSRFSRSDLTLLQLIKAGKEGVFYKARMTRGTCKGHDLFTCKISKEGVTPKRVDVEVSIMRKLVHHKNVLQLLDWNSSEAPYVLIMEFVSYGTLRSFLQTHKERLSEDPELQSLLTIASYHIALAMQGRR